MARSQVDYFVSVLLADKHKSSNAADLQYLQHNKTSEGNGVCGNTSAITFELSPRSSTCIPLAEDLISKLLDGFDEIKLNSSTRFSQLRQKAVSVGILIFSGEILLLIYL